MLESSLPKYFHYTSRFVNPLFVLIKPLWYEQIALSTLKRWGNWGAEMTTVPWWAKCLNLPCYQAAKQRCLVRCQTCQPASLHGCRIIGPVSLNMLPTTGDALSLTKKSYFKTACEAARFQPCHWHKGKDVELGQYKYSLVGVCLISCKHAETQKQRQQRMFSSSSLHQTRAACRHLPCQQQLKLRCP